MYSHPLSIFHNIFKRIDCNSCMHNKTEFLRNSVKFCIVKPFIKQFIVNNHWCILCTFNLLLTMRGLCLDRSKLKLHESTNSTDLHVMTSDFRVAAVTCTMVTFTFMENCLFLLCNVLINNDDNLRNTFIQILWIELIKWFK